MKALEEKILREGKVLPGNVLKVGNFLNHQIDINFLMEMGEEIARLYSGCGVNKIVTIETSGIAIAVAAALYMKVPVVFAKKSKTSNLPENVYSSTVVSYTHGNVSEIVVSKDYLNSNDKVLIVDDFLAHGNALKGLIELIDKAGASLVGAAIAIEKGFQDGGK
jgi:xanthine phosphoribosyltransferase